MKIKKIKFFSSNFIYNKINKDIKQINNILITRFSPEAGGGLHMGHIKNILVNLEISKIYNGLCILRFDDTNPKKNKKKFIKLIKNNIIWITKNLKKKINKKIFFTSNHFYKLYQWAELMIKNKFSYVDINKNIKNNLKNFRKIRNGYFKEKTKILKLNIKTKKKNKNLKNPKIYRILYKKHHRTGYNWLIYPLYDYANSMSDKIEKIIYSICSLEFEENKLLYNWILKKNGIYKKKFPRQIEFSRLNFKNNITSKKKLTKLIKKKYIKNWKDSLIYSVEAIKNKGYTSNGINLFCKKIGINKNKNKISEIILKKEVINDVKKKIKNIITIKNTLKIIFQNYPFKKIKKIYIKQKNENKILYFSKEILVEKNNFIKNKKLINFNKKIKLKYSYIIKCKNFKKINNKIETIYCKYYKINFIKNKKMKTINWINSNYKNKILIEINNKLYNKKKLNTKIKKTMIMYTQNYNIKNFLKFFYYFFEKIGYFIIKKKETKLFKIKFDYINIK